MSSRDPHAGLVSSRRSKFYYLDMLAEEPALQARLGDRSERAGMYTSMLVDDVARILPYGRGTDDGFTVVVDSDDARAPNLVRNALPTEYWPARSLARGVRDFVENTARQVMTEPAAVFEIDYLRRPADPDGVPVAFRLEPLPPGSVGHLNGEPIQYVPTAVGDEETGTGLHFVRLDPRQLITIVLDPASTRAANDAMRLLDAADQYQGTPLHMLEQGQRTKTGFDFNSFRGATNRVLLAGTREIGWDGRQLFTEGALAPYTVWRHLQFARFKIKVRDAALAGLSEAVTRASAVMGFDATVRLTGVHTAADIDRAELDLESGRVAFRDLLRTGS